MEVPVGEAAAVEMDDFVDAVGELVAAVLDVHAGLVLRQVGPVDVGDPAHAMRPMMAPGRRS